MLTHNAFESGMLFEQTLVQDELPLRRQACADFWRRHCYPLPLGVARAVSQEWSGPEALLADLSGYLHGEGAGAAPAAERGRNRPDAPRADRRAHRCHQGANGVRRRAIWRR